MLAFKGSPLRKIDFGSEQDKQEAHERLLNTAMIKHLHAINWCMSDLGSRAYHMTPEMFLEDRRRHPPKTFSVSCGMLYSPDRSCTN